MSANGELRDGEGGTHFRRLAGNNDPDSGSRWFHRGHRRGSRRPFWRRRRRRTTKRLMMFVRSRRRIMGVLGSGGGGRAAFPDMGHFRQGAGIENRGRGPAGVSNCVQPKKTHVEYRREGLVVTYQERPGTKGFTRHPL